MRDESHGTISVKKNKKIKQKKYLEPKMMARAVCAVLNGEKVGSSSFGGGFTNSPQKIEGYIHRFQR